MGGEHVASGGGDDPVVFEADAELADDIDAGFVGEGHAGFERSVVAAYEVRPLVAVHADAVAEAVSEVLIVGTVAGVGDHFAGGIINSVAGLTGFACSERSGLGFVNDVEDLLLFVGRLAKDEGARDVGLVAFDGAAVVEEDDLSLLNDLRLKGAMGERGVLAYLAGGEAGEACAQIAGGDELGDLAVGHAGFERLPSGFVDVEGVVVGEAHEGELGGRFNGAAASGDGGSADGSEVRAGVSDAVGEGELRTLFDSDAARDDAGVFEGFCEEGVGTVVLVPGVDLGDGGLRKRGGLGFHALADATFFKYRADDEGGAFDGKDPGEETFRLPPGEAGEVVERGPGADDESVYLVFCEEIARAFDAVFALFEGDGNGFGATIFESSERGREFEVGGRCLGPLGA